jgi:hypothetical protein
MDDEKPAHTDIIAAISPLFKPLAEWTEVQMIKDATGVPPQVFVETFVKAIKAFDKSGCGRDASKDDNYIALREALREEYVPGMGRDEAFALGAALGVAYTTVIQMDIPE